MGEVWVTSDQHILHPLVARLRGFATAVACADHQARIWDRRIGDDDDVWVCGDVAMGDRSVSLPWFGRRPGRKHLVLGNHDRAHPMHNNAHRFIAEYATVFDTVQTMARISVADGEPKVNLSHFPYEGDRNAERFSEWRMRDSGRTLLHGHTHLQQVVSRTRGGTLQVHIGVDAWDLSPVRRSTIAQVINENS